MRPSRLAWALCGFATTATVVTAALRILIAAASHGVPADLEAGTGDLMWPLVVLGFAFVGALVASRQPANAVGWIFCIGAVALSLSGLAESYAVYTLFADPGGLLGGGKTMAWLSVWVWVPGGVSLIALFPLLFPDGKLLTPRWRAVVGLALAAMVTLSVGIALTPGEFDDFPHVENPYGVAGAAGDVFSAMQGLGWLLLILSLIASATSVVLRFRRSRGVERLQLKWVAAASVVLVASFLLWEVWEGMAPLGIFAMVLAAGIAILRYRLYDIDVVINRTLVYGALTATLAVTYLGSVLLLQLGAERHHRGLRARRRRRPHSRWRRCSAPPARVSRQRWTGASTGASTTRSAPSRASRAGCATRSSSIRSARRCAWWWRRRCSPPTCRCGWRVDR